MRLTDLSLEVLEPPSPLPVKADRTRITPFFKKNEIELVNSWLSTKRGNSTATFENAKVEAERFVWYCHVIAKKSFLEWSDDDCGAYRDFLLAPINKKYVSEKSIRRDDPKWTPFRKDKLAKVSVKQSMVMMSSFFKYLVHYRHIEVNPSHFINLSTPKKKYKGTLPYSFIEMVYRYIEFIRNSDEANTEKPLKTTLLRSKANLKYSPHPKFTVRTARTKQLRLSTVRATLLLKIALNTGLRCSELLNLSHHDIRRIPDFGEDAYEITVVNGKGGDDRRVPIMIPGFTRLLTEYRLSTIGFSTENHPVFWSLPRGEGRPAKPLAHRQEIYRILKDLFNGTLEHFQGELAEDELRDAQSASTHWLRHTFGTHVLKSGILVTDVADMMGHKDLSTTLMYSHTKQDAVRAGMARIPVL